MKSEVAQMRELLRLHIAALRSKLITCIDDKLTTFSKSSPPSSMYSEPAAVLTDVSFLGDPSQLTSFLYSTYDSLRRFTKLGSRPMTNV